MKLPCEIQEQIFIHLPFEKAVSLSNHVAKKLYDINIHTYAFAIKHKNVDMVNWLYKNTNRIITKIDVYYAIGIGNLKILSKLYDLFGESFPQDDILESGFDRIKHLEFNMWLFSNEIKDILAIKCFMDFASNRGHLDIVQWLYDKPKDFWCTPDTMNFAAKNGHKDIVEFLYKKNRDFWCSNKAMKYAAEYGHFDIVKLLYNDTRDFWCIKQAMNYAAESGHLEILRWLYDKHGNENSFTNVHRMSWNGKTEDYTIDRVAGNGHLHILLWIHEIAPHTVCTNDAMDFACGNGHLEVAEWLYDNKPITFTMDAVNCAAEDGHLHVLKWLHDIEPDYFTYIAIDNACYGGRLEVVKWLHEYTDVYCTSESLLSASQNGHLTVVKWLCINRPEILEYVDLAIVEAYRYSNLDIVNWLYDNIQI